MDMSSLIISTKVNIRNKSTFFKDLSLAYGVSRQPDHNSLINEAGVSKPLRHLANNPEWSTPPLRGHTHYFLKHNNFRDQELYDRVHKQHCTARMHNKTLLLRYKI